MNFKLKRWSFIFELSDIFLFFLTKIEEHHQKLLRNISTAHTSLSVFSLSFAPFLPVDACLLYIDSLLSGFILLLDIFSRVVTCSIHGLGCVVERPNLKALHSSTPAAIAELPVFLVCQYRTEQCFGQSNYWRDGFMSPSATFS